VEHQPPNYDYPQGKPLVFLGGPIQGASDWQHQAIENFQSIPNQKYLDELHVANPRRSELDRSKFDYGEQVTWEKQHLVQARENGAIIFWFAARNYDLAYDDSRAYAQTSRIEFGRALGWYDYREFDLFLGIEDGYKGSEKYFASCAEEHKLNIYSDLGEMCLAAATAIDQYEEDVSIGAVERKGK